MKCNWTENDTKVSYTSYDMAMPYYKIIECNSTNTKRDKDNINERYFCEIHLKQVKETRKLMHKHCINKEKLINELRNNIYLGKIGTCCAPNLLKIIIKIQNGEFDNE